jgi:uncharacterized membrane protein YfcA
MIIKRLVQAIFAFLAGVIVVNFGLAGGMILVPILMYTGDKLKKAAATSLAVIAFIALSGTYQHIQITRSLKFDDGNVLLLTMGLLGAIIGSVLLTKVKNKTLTLLTTIYFFIVGGILIFSATYNEVEFLYELPKNVYWIMGLPIAFLSSFFGIGSGSMLTPALMFGFNATPKEAIAITLPFIFLLTFTSTLINIKNNLLDYVALMIMIPFAVFGSLSARVVYFYVQDIHIQIALGSLMVLTAFVMTIRSISRS